MCVPCAITVESKGLRQHQRRGLIDQHSHGRNHTIALNKTSLNGSSAQVNIQIQLTNVNIPIDLRQFLIKVTAFGTTIRQGESRLQRCSCPSRNGAYTNGTLRREQRTCPSPWPTATASLAR